MLDEVGHDQLFCPQCGRSLKVSVDQVVTHVPIFQDGYDTSDGKLIYAEVTEEACECGYSFTYEYAEGGFQAVEIRKLAGAES